MSDGIGSAVAKARNGVLQGDAAEVIRGYFIEPLINGKRKAKVLLGAKIGIIFHAAYGTKTSLGADKNVVYRNLGGLLGQLITAHVAAVCDEQSASVEEGNDLLQILF